MPPMPSASVTASCTRSVKSLSQRSNLVMPTPITHTLRLAMAEEPTGGARPRQGTYSGLFQETLAKPRPAGVGLANHVTFPPRMRPLAALLLASLLVAPAAHAGVDDVVVGAFLGGSTAGGDPAPDNDGVFFGFGVPVINDAGEVAFPCSFTTGSGGTAIVRGSTAPGDRHIVVRQGNPAPDANGNFGGFDPTLATAAINGNGQVAFPTTFVGTFGTGDRSG